MFKKDTCVREMSIKIIGRIKKTAVVFYQAMCALMITLSFLSLSYAAACYGTRVPEKGKILSGFQTHAIFKRYLEDEKDKLRSTQHFLLLSYGAFDWLSIDLKGGAGNIRQHPIGADEIKYTSGFAGGYGFRLRLYNGDNIKAVAGFQHISVHPRSTHEGSTKHQAVLDDWQISALVSLNYVRFSPYLGTKWSRIDYIHRAEGNRKRVMSDLTKSIGLVCGCDISLTKNIWLNVEGQLFDTEAVAFSLNFGY